MYKHFGFTGMSPYDFLDIVSTVVLFVFNLTQYKRKKNLQSYSTQFLQNKIAKTNKKILTPLSTCVFWVVLEILFFSYAQYVMTAFVNKKFGDILQTGANYFGKLYHIPFLLVAFCILFWVDPTKQIDLITPAYPIALFFSKLGCFCQGCCRGFEWEAGLYNETSGCYEFPLQLVEAILALLIFIFLMLWRDKAKPGTMFPTYLIIYSSTRFFSEFLSAKDNVFGILKTYHILCLIGIAAGVVELLIALKFGESISKFFNETHYGILNKPVKKKAKKKSK